MEHYYYDLIGVGIGPFNLGLAALSQTIRCFTSLFFEKEASFDWHPGIMIEGTKLQVPFYADLVTVVDPTSPYSFLNYLKEKQKLFRFAIKEDHFITRKEFRDYCRWAAQGLSNLQYGAEVREIIFLEESNGYQVTVFYREDNEVRKFYAKHIVLGIGSSPYLPHSIKENAPLIIHSSNYLTHKTTLARKQQIALIGSGQSAAEIFYDLLQTVGDSQSLHWFTRSNRFKPMDYSKFALEMTSLDYIDYFYDLHTNEKERVLEEQAGLYKGINFSLINDIYELLYARWLGDGTTRHRLYPAVVLKSCQQINKSVLEIKLFHTEQKTTFSATTDALILATGYKQYIPPFLDRIKERLKWTDGGLYDVNRNYSIDHHDTVFVQNSELHTHGFSAPDLGMGPYRNATILNTILKKEIFKLERNVCFQQFGAFQEPSSIP